MKPPHGSLVVSVESERFPCGIGKFGESPVNESDNGWKSNSLGSWAKPRKLCMVESVEAFNVGPLAWSGNASIPRMVTIVEVARVLAGAHRR